VLSTAPFRAAASAAPGFLGVALEPPIAVEAVAAAASRAALGLLQGSSPLDTHDKIVAAAAL
jgi:hypothetical protein